MVKKKSDRKVIKAGLVGGIGSAIILVSSLLYKPEIHPQTLDALARRDYLKAQYEVLDERFDRGLSFYQLIDDYDWIYSDGKRKLDLTVEKAKYMLQDLRDVDKEMVSLENRPDIQNYWEIQKDLGDIFETSVYFGLLCSFMIGFGMLGESLSKENKENPIN